MLCCKCWHQESGKYKDYRRIRIYVKKLKVNMNFKFKIK